MIDRHLTEPTGAELMSTRPTTAPASLGAHPLFFMLTLTIMTLLGCDDEPSACTSDSDCREGFVCDTTIYKGECIQSVQVIRCGERLCQYPPEVCVRDTCVVMTQRDGEPPLSSPDATPTAWDQGGASTSDAQTPDMRPDLGPQEDLSPPRDLSPPEDAAPPVDRGALDLGGEPCVSACDCTPGQSCQAGQCAMLSEPVYCCSGDFCPPEASCETLEGRRDVCATECTSACDCSPGMRCEDGGCVIGDSPLFCCNSGPCPAGAACETPSQRQLTCASDSCISACDCAAGNSCDNGTCVSANPPVFCCTEGLCPAGQLCESPAGQRATCVSDQTCVSACDCSPGRSCLGGTCTMGNEPVYCCDDAPNCPPDSICQPSTGGRFELCQ